MTGTEPALADLLPATAYGLALVLARLGSLCMLAPGLGEPDLPPMVRAALALVLTALVLPPLLPALPSVPTGIAPVLAAVAGELAIGGFLGVLARLTALALPIAGQIVALLTGLSSVLQPEGVFGAQGTPLARVFGLAAPLLFLGSGLYAVPLRAAADSFRLLPPGAAPAFVGPDALVAAIGGAFGVALRLASPFVLATLLWQSALALLSRIAPALQIYGLASPVQILGGLLLLGALGGGMLDAWGIWAGATLAALPVPVPVPVPAPAHGQP